MTDESMIALTFANSDETSGYGLGDITLHLARPVSTKDTNTRCMVLYSGTDLLGYLVAMFAAPFRKSFEFVATEASSFSLHLERVDDKTLRVSDSKGVVGVVEARPLIYALLVEIERLAARCLPDPRDGNLQDIKTFGKEVRAKFP